MLYSHINVLHRLAWIRSVSSSLYTIVTQETVLQLLCSCCNGSCALVSQETVFLQAHCLQILPNSQWKSRIGQLFTHLISYWLVPKVFFIQLNLWLRNEHILDQNEHIPVSGFRVLSPPSAGNKGMTVQNDQIERFVKSNGPTDTKMTIK